MIPETRPCEIPSVPEMATNKDLINYTLEVIAELKRCSQTIEMLRKWIEGVNSHAVDTQ